MFISHPEVKQKLSVHAKIRQEYRSLKRIQSTKIVGYAALAMVMTAFGLIKQPLGFIWAGPLVVVLVSLFHKSRRCVAVISEQFLLDNILPEEINRQSLFQICEGLSQAHSIPSLVDIITYQDTIGRKVLLGTVLFLLFVYPLNSWQVLVGTGAIAGATLVIGNAPIVLRRLK
jgi:hypothetical protein